MLLLELFIDIFVSCDTEEVEDVDDEDEDDEAEDIDGGRDIIWEESDCGVCFPVAGK